MLFLKSLGEISMEKNKCPIEQELSAMAEIVVSTLYDKIKDDFGVDPDTHKLHHDFIGALMEKCKTDKEIAVQHAKDRHDTSLAIQRAILQWSVVGILSGVIYYISNGSWPSIDKIWGR